MKYYLLLILIFLNINPMEESTSSYFLLNQYARYDDLIKDIATVARPEALMTSVEYSLSYSTYRVQIMYAGETHPYIALAFEAYDGKLILDEAYCEQKNRIDDLKKVILEKLGSYRPEEHSVSAYDKVKNYLEIADRIAMQSLNCNAGDNWRPGYYGKMTRRPEGIILTQINRMNAKSLDHKDDYMMRDLIIEIPLSDTLAESRESLDTVMIGRMKINFSDYSSEKNRTCGDKMQQQIDLEKEQFEASEK